MKVEIYGIANCDATKKTIDWFEENKIPFRFHDYKSAGIGKEKLISWDKKAGWENFFNKRSRTWRLVSDDHPDGVTTLALALKIMLEYNSIIKRPVIETGGPLIIGYDENKFSLLKNNQ
jgi:arsenate reductase